MTQIFTLNENDVIRYIYNETTSAENDRIAEALLFDVEMLDFYLACSNLKEGFDTSLLTPPKLVIDNIMAYSRKYAPEV